MKKYKNITTGFTLVEVVIAMALLILSLAAFTVSFVQSRRSAAIADNRLEAIHVARGQMETICSSNYNAIGLPSGVYTGSYPVYTSSYTVYINSYTVSNNMSAKVKDIVVTICWTNPLGKIISTVSLAGSVSSNLHQ